MAVLASREMRLARIILRDSLTPKEAEQRLSFQKTDAFYEEKADFIIRNDGDLSVLRTEALAILDHLSCKL